VTTVGPVTVQASHQDGTPSPITREDGLGTQTVLGAEAKMTLIMEAAPTTTVVEQSIQRPAAHTEASTRWASAAVRAHALLSQTMPDEDIDELLDAAAPFDQAIVLPAFFFG
jgi:hypothetical protein